MNFQEEFPSVNDELAQKQADEIIEIFKSIKKAISSKFEKSAKKYGFTAPAVRCYISFTCDAINNASCFK